MCAKFHGLTKKRRELWPGNKFPSFNLNQPLTIIDVFSRVFAMKASQNRENRIEQVTQVTRYVQSRRNFREKKLSERVCERVKPGSVHSAANE